MNELWQLPKTAVICGVEYPIETDFRTILRIIGYLNHPKLPEIFRWRIALKLFYGQEELGLEAMEFLCRFISGGQESAGQTGKLLDWQLDADLIVADVNRVAGTEIRALPYVHWWTFLSWFHGIGEGQLSTVIAIRQKRQEGKKLSDWEADYYRRNRAAVDLPTKISREEQEEKDRLMTQLGLGKREKGR